VADIESLPEPPISVMLEPPDVVMVVLPLRGHGDVAAAVRRHGVVAGAADHGDAGAAGGAHRVVAGAAETG